MNCRNGQHDHNDIITKNDTIDKQIVTDNQVRTIGVLLFSAIFV